MASSSIDAIIECPFFVFQEKNYITCESYIPNTTHKLYFRRLDDQRNHITKVCSCNQGKKCLHYRIMSTLYERGVLK